MMTASPFTENYESEHSCLKHIIKCPVQDFALSHGTVRWLWSILNIHLQYFKYQKIILLHYIQCCLHYIISFRWPTLGRSLVWRTYWFVAKILGSVFLSRIPGFIPGLKSCIYVWFNKNPWQQPQTWEFFPSLDLCSENTQSARESDQQLLTPRHFD